MLVAALALTFDRILQRKLEKAGLRSSSRAAWEALEAVSLVEFEMPGGRGRRGSVSTARKAVTATRRARCCGRWAWLWRPRSPPENGDRIVH